MLSEEEKEQAARGNWKTFSRSLTWTERPPKKSNPKPQWNSKARACLPPLQPLSIVRPNIEEWPRAGSDDLGVWPNHPPTPGARSTSVTPREVSTSGQPPREFEFKKDKLAFFDKECSRIIEHVYLGSDAVAKNRAILRENGVTHVLNCVGFVCPEYFKKDLVYKTLWLQDCPSEDITSILYDVFDYFEDVRQKKGRVLVHCCQGISRSTSLVIAYLMWKEGQSFDDAFQLVKSARGVTNPNMGFACQLLQCQKRVHALPASPTSLLRMYRMAPHSPYDPLHLVPKILCEVGPDKLDSRGAFIVHVPSALFVWIGDHCSQVMSENASSAASQICRYESAKCPVLTVKEGDESFEFWDAIGCKKSLAEDKKRRLDEYDLDFEIFHRALAGGVVPPFPLPEGGSEMCLPARQNGWSKLRRKFASGIMKEFISSKSKSIVDTSSKFKESIPSSNILTDNQSDSATSLPWSPSYNLVDSFSSFLVSKPKADSRSPSVSPSTSDYSTSFTFSPSSSNWSDSSIASAQPSPCGLTDSSKSCLSVESVDGNGYLLDNENSRSPEEDISAARSNLPSIDETSQISDNLCKYLEDDVMRDVECKNLSREVSFELDGEEPISDASSYAADDDEDTVGLHHMANDVAERPYIEIYELPSLHKMEIHSEVIDSGCMYAILLVPALNIGSVCYVWIGKDCQCEGGHAHLNIRNLLIEKGISTDAEVKMVKEGEEPVELLEHMATNLRSLNHFSMGETK